MIDAGLRKLVWDRHRQETSRIGSDRDNNVGLACFHCNSSKGTDIASLDPSDDRLTPLFNPRRDVWIAHFLWDGPLLIALTPVGRVTVHILNINHEERVAIRASLLDEGSNFDYSAWPRWKVLRPTGRVWNSEMLAGYNKLGEGLPQEQTICP